MKRVGMIGIALAGAWLMAGQAADAEGAFPYRGATFDSFVKESFEVAGKPEDWGSFYKNMDELAVKATGQDWEKWIAANPDKHNAAQERAAAEDVWRRIKKTIRHFSLDRGFEFSNTVAYNERQCFLQSVFLSGVMQKAGYNAGVVMVWRNPQGQTSNNGHAVTVLRMANGKDILVDDSESEPFPEHTGLFMRLGGTYKYVMPIFEKDSTISGYKPASGGQTIKNTYLTTLDVPFLRSQFDYYRGERTPGGFMGKPQTAAGLAQSEKWLRRSLQRAPGNPLSQAVLMDVLLAEKKPSEAAPVRQTAVALYAKYGWAPERFRGATPVAAVK